MTKNKINFEKNINHWFTSHPWIKLISLVFAVLLWLYAKDTIGKFGL